MCLNTTEVGRKKRGSVALFFELSFILLSLGVFCWDAFFVPLSSSPIVKAGGVRGRGEERTLDYNVVSGGCWSGLLVGFSLSAVWHAYMPSPVAPLLSYTHASGMDFLPSASFGATMTRAISPATRNLV